MKRQRSPADLLRRPINPGFEGNPGLSSLVGDQPLRAARSPSLGRPYGVTQGAGVQDAGKATPSGDLEGQEEEEPRIRQMRAEAVLLVSKTPLTLRKLAQLAHLADATEARTLVRQLNRIYDSLGRAIRIELVAGGYRMLTRPALSPWLAKLGHLPPQVRLSTPMMETLAVIAYRQPVSRASAEAVRGVACGELLRQLMERDLIRIIGRSEELGRPYLYGTTKRFLQLFGLPDVGDLPPIQWQTLQDDPIPEHSSPEHSTIDDSSTPTKEPDVSISDAPVFAEAETEIFVTTDIAADVAIPGTDGNSPQPDSQHPSASIDDDDEDLYDESDEEDDDWGDDDDDDWDDDEDPDDDNADPDDDDPDDDDADDDDADDAGSEDKDKDNEDLDDDLDEGDDDWEEVDDDDSDLDDDDDDEWDDDDEESDDDDEEDWD